ncbi:MAG: hypothetical protein JO257_16845 [Deltaproteobacteria bacterium]|nr:hypothetical protein [Deltaproteobacteria bacterium]
MDDLDALARDACRKRISAHPIQCEVDLGKRTQRRGAGRSKPSLLLIACAHDDMPVAIIILAQLPHLPNTSSESGGLRDDN